MFYCDDCREKQNWPEGFAKSEGPCECCGEVAPCNDVPSKLLGPPPDPERAAALRRMEHELAKEGKL